VLSFSLTWNPLNDKELLLGSPNGSTLLTVRSSTLHFVSRQRRDVEGRLRPEGSLCFDFAQHPELAEGSKEGEHSKFSPKAVFQSSFYSLAAESEIRNIRKPVKVFLKQLSY